MIIGKPSASLADKLEKDEKERIDAQVKALGPDGLKKAEALLEEAKAEHSKPIPTDVLTSFPVPDVKSISWIPVQSVQEPGKGRKSLYPAASDDSLSKVIGADGEPLPFFVQYDHVEVRVSCQLKLTTVCLPLLPSLTLLAFMLCFHSQNCPTIFDRTQSTSVVNVLLTH